MRSRPFLLILFLLTAFSTLAPELAAQGCSACKAAAETGTDANGNSIAGGLNNAILYLMFVPYVLLFIFFRKRIFAFWKELRGLWG
jgi:hypothetical protein